MHSLAPTHLEKLADGYGVNDDFFNALTPTHTVSEYLMKYPRRSGRQMPAGHIHTRQSAINFFSLRYPHRLEQVSLHSLHQDRQLLVYHTLNSNFLMS